MLPATTWVKPPTAISQVISVITPNLALSAPGIIHTMAAIRKPDATPRKAMSHQPASRRG